MAQSSPSKPLNNEARERIENEPDADKECWKIHAYPKREFWFDPRPSIESFFVICSVAGVGRVPSEDAGIAISSRRRLKHWAIMPIACDRLSGLDISEPVVISRQSEIQHYP
jgi:hypothetical protein